MTNNRKPSKEQKTDPAAKNAAPFNVDIYRPQHIVLGFTTTPLLGGDAGCNSGASLHLTIKGGSHRLIVDEDNVDGDNRETQFFDKEYTIFTLQVFDNKAVGDLIDALVELGERLKPLAVARLRPVKKLLREREAVATKNSAPELKPGSRRRGRPRRIEHSAAAE